MNVAYSPAFIRMLKGLPPELVEEALEKIELFKNAKNHPSLKVHKLKGRLQGRYSFFVDYKTRIVFTYLDKKRTACLLAVGDHEVYNV